MHVRSTLDLSQCNNISCDIMFMLCCVLVKHVSDQLSSICSQIKRSLSVDHMVCTLFLISVTLISKPLHIWPALFSLHASLGLV